MIEFSFFGVVLVRLGCRLGVLCRKGRRCWSRLLGRFVGVFCG